MTTFKTTHAFTSANDFSAEMVKEFTGNYIMRGKTIDVDAQDPMKLFNRNRWVMERIGRVLDVSGKLDPETTSFRIDRDENKTIHIRFIDIANGDTLYTLDVNNTEDDRNYVLRDSSGNEVVTSMKWTGIKKYFAPLPSTTESTTTESINETPIAEAAAPVKKNSESSPSSTSSSSEEESLDDLTSIPDEL